MAHDLDLSGLQTEAINICTSHIDRVSTREMCAIMNNEDQKVATSVTPCLDDIARAIDLLLPRVRRGGRVIYIGAGTSGRLGVLDSSEILPTFAAPSTQFVGLIAGGDAAIRMAQEGAEDSFDDGRNDLAGLELDPERDSVIGIAASGRTPYVLGALDYAKCIGALTIGIACVSPSSMNDSGTVDVMISPLPGPEIVTGSTRLKAGTATKLVLNMLSTGTMIKAGKTYGNMMVDLIASNEKLAQRSRNILRSLSTRCFSMTEQSLDDLLAKCDRSVKLALVVVERGLTVEQGRQQLKDADGVLDRVLHPNKDNHLQKLAIYGFGPYVPVLCIDGGGSKCAAVTAISNNIRGQGISGPCNLTDGKFDLTIKSMVTATSHSLDDLAKALSEENGNDMTGKPNSPKREKQSLPFPTVWIAAAGMDRPGMRERVKAVLSPILGLNESTNIRITNDVDLLAAAMIRHPEISSSIVLIAGTGSIAIRYAVDGETLFPKRIIRSGGWGHLLGDEGAGYAIGREAIRYTLWSIEEFQLGLQKIPLTFLAKRIISIFNDSAALLEEGSVIVDLLSQVLVGGDDQLTKARIARVAQTVLNAADEGDDEASRILLTQVSALFDRILSRLLMPQSHGYVNPSRCGLILAGGVMLHKAYQNLFHSRLAADSIKFAYVETVSNAALIGVEYMLNSQ
ncbi:putative glucokinase regulator family protein [Talaromyces proteolyticus]|uniref:N-acetyl-D-glucosamine kinase n=1 Tax=Talaromyces proteolyticus TaxID=1131652 RepID=A0AAD4KFD0_9EURO|nr:putative glucokinase regulator family protein [Talaromyces proteolyticus]KAH8690314.1 putative glucokinase regulator family protein [Talaromyces proteolyticus]